MLGQVVQLNWTVQRSAAHSWSEKSETQLCSCSRQNADFSPIYHLMTQHFYNSNWEGHVYMAQGVGHPVLDRIEAGMVTKPRNTHACVSLKSILCVCVCVSPGKTIPAVTWPLTPL